MTDFDILFQIGPPSHFGLPDGTETVVPAGNELVGPVLDTRSGLLVGHGTLSKYREPAQALSTKFEINGLRLTFNDNFLTVTVEAPSPQSAADRVRPFVANFTQCLSTMYGKLFESRLLSVQDVDGKPHRVLSDAIAVKILQATTYNIDDLEVRVKQAASWAAQLDQIAKKALFYFEHACLLNDFSQTLPMESPHVSFSRALAFLQLFKALTSIIGDPSTDRDYQKRFRSIGLPKDFWEKRAQPLYKIRNDSDVAHYSHSFPELGAYASLFYEAARVFRDALDAYLISKNKLSQ